MILVIGAGYMAKEYVRVLKALEQNILVVGRGENRVREIQDEFNVEAVAGGLSDYLQSMEQVPEAAVVCTPVETLASFTKELIESGVKRILLEKPGALATEELTDLAALEKKNNAKVSIGYNRRFYQATLSLLERLKTEELIAANFEITEWSHLIEKEPCAEVVKQRWVLSNTSHVIDLVSFVAGAFETLNSYTSGNLDWHNSAARFVGAGVTENKILISYCGYWDGPGRWSAEFVTTQNRYILRPMEKLQVQRKGSVAIESVGDIDYRLDEDYKPGLYKQVSAFLSNDLENFCSLEEQISSFATYQKIACY